MARDQIGTFASLNQVVDLKQLFKTKTGKILRGTMKRIVEGEIYYSLNHR